MHIAEDDLIIISNAALQYAVANMDVVVLMALDRLGGAMLGPEDVVVRKDRGKDLTPEVASAIAGTKEVHSRFKNGEF